MSKTIAMLVAVGGLAAAVQGQVTFNLVNQIDLNVTQDNQSASYIGSNPSAVAWDGRDMYVAGWNNGRGDGDTNAIVRISDAANSASIGSAFGAFGTPNFRGYLSLDIKDGLLAAAYETGGNNPNGLSVWDTSSTTQVWTVDTRPVSGTWDAAANGGNAVSWAQFGSGRLRVSDGSDGSLIFDGSDGPIIYPGSGGTLWRGQDIDANGDIYMRENNQVIAADRTGENTTTNVRFIAMPTGAGQAGQFVNVMNTPFGDFVVYNDRTGAGTTFGASLNVIDTDGGAVSVAWNGVDLDQASNGWYDFDYDAASGTLAVVDFTNRQAYVFSVVPAPASLALLGLGGLCAARRRR
jgi:hypothetical protein